MTRALAFAAAAAALLASPSVARTGRVAPPAVKADHEVVGTLTEARVHFLTAATKRPNDFAAHMGLRANLPAVLVTAGGDVYYLTTAPADLARLAGKTVKVVGKLQPDAGALQPARFWAKGPDGWAEERVGREGGR